VGVQTVQRHKKWDTSLWCAEASTSANLVNAVHKGMAWTSLKFFQHLHEVQLYPSKGKWLCGDEQCFAVLAKSCICYPETWQEYHIDNHWLGAGYAILHIAVT
jgi:hypothetical protein